MRKKLTRIAAAFMAVAFLFSTTVYGSYTPTTPKFKTDICEIVTPERHEFTKPAVERKEKDEETVEVVEVVEVVPETVLSEEEIELLALVTMAEAEGEPELGQRLVIDTVLNRMDSPYFPDTIYDVIYQKNQFSSMWNGRVERCYVRDDIVQLIREELVSRTNTEVVFFRTQHYSAYGVPLFQVGHHYFSSYD